MNPVDITEMPELLEEIRLMRYKYDDRGSYYFHKITQQPQYYLCTKEQELLDTKLDQILQPLSLPVHQQSSIEIAEFGCGMGRKTLALLRGVVGLGKGRVAFVPVDISSYYLNEV